MRSRMVTEHAIPNSYASSRRCFSKPGGSDAPRGTRFAAWAAIVKEVRWHNFLEVRNTFKDADNVKGYVIFNIRQNRYRLITVIHYAKTDKVRRTQGHVYIRSFLTHKEYDNPANWDRRFATK